MPAPEVAGMGPHDPAHFRRVLGLFPTGVTVVTALDQGVPVGLSVGSFTSVSLDPPLVGFCVDVRSTTWPRIRKAGVVCVNVLAEDQEAVSRIFATPSADRFAGLAWDAAPAGSPILAGVVAWIEALVDQEVPAGDHWLVLAGVTALGGDDRPGGQALPLVFHRGAYRRLSR